MLRRVNNRHYHGIVITNTSNDAYNPLRGYNAHICLDTIFSTFIDDDKILGTIDTIMHHFSRDIFYVG